MREPVKDWKVSRMSGNQSSIARNKSVMNFQKNQSPNVVENVLQVFVEDSVILTLQWLRVIFVNTSDEEIVRRWGEGLISLGHIPHFSAVTF